VLRADIVESLAKLICITMKE